MNLQDEEKVYEKDLDTTRRGFLKIASAGVILASGLLAIPESEAKSKDSIPKALKFLVYDPALCTGCGTCQVVCSTLWNKGKASYEISRISVSRNPFGTNEDNYSPNVCLQCVDAPCVKACPLKAIKVDVKSGINTRVIDEARCKGLKKCIEACPYEEKRIAFYKEQNKAIKCHLCNGNPQCVRWCPNGALKFMGPPEFTPVMEYLSEKSKRPMMPKSYQIVLKEDREKELGYPREE
ncbi:MAG: hypothetical protein N2746_09020 [Deltaproteobacteria bacterium]|nr:hypothetical protein [Deltaproteobacteria bacterium]